MRPGNPPTLLGKAAHHTMAGRCSQVLKAGGGQSSSCLLLPFPVPPTLGHLPDYPREHKRKPCSLGLAEPPWSSAQERLQCHPPETQQGWWVTELLPTGQAELLPTNSSAEEATELPGRRPL